MSDDYAYGMWVVVAFNIGLFLFFFLSFLPPKANSSGVTWDWSRLSWSPCSVKCMDSH